MFLLSMPVYVRHMDNAPSHLLYDIDFYKKTFSLAGNKIKKIASLTKKHQEAFFRFVCYD